MLTSHQSLQLALIDQFSWIIFRCLHYAFSVKTKNIETIQILANEQFIDRSLQELRCLENHDSPKLILLTAHYINIHLDKEVKAEKGSRFVEKSFKNCDIATTSKFKKVRNIY